MVILVLFLCSNTIGRKRHLTERLFLEKKRISITHPDDKPPSAANVLSEEVTFRSEPLKDDGLAVEGEEASLDTNKVYTLKQVTVTSRARFASVREGHVNIDFLIHIPGEFLSDDFQVLLVPELTLGDSVVRLEEVVLRGKNFIERQEQDYERFKNYLASIVDPASYDSVFVDHSGVKRELDRRRNNELDQYYQQWSVMQEYRHWRNNEQAKYDEYNIKQDERLRQKLIKHDEKFRVAVSRQLATLQDTSALGKKYRAERKKMIDSAPVRKQITLEAVPARYREIYLRGIGPEDLEPMLPQEEDSLVIAKSFVLHQQIAANDMKGARQQETFQYMVPYPYLPDAHYNAVIIPEKDYVYRYTKSISIVPGIKNLSLVLGGTIVATDRSLFKVPKTEKLTYVISTMDELADGSLLANEEFTDSQRDDYALALQYLRNREYQRALSILNDFKDYNTALALTCLGYDKQAYSLLIQLPKNADTHYLGAIICARLKDTQAAVDHLMEACSLDPTKIERAQRDPEMAKLINDHNLQQYLDQINN
jgi:hypothetical protein